MPPTIAPCAPYMILCDDVLPDPQRPGKLLIVGLTSLVNWPCGMTTPVRLETLVVLLVLTEGRGSGMSQIVCRNEETRVPIFRSPNTPISFDGKDLSGHYGVTFKLLDCRFPEPGVYVVQFVFDGTLVEEQFLTVR
jgi:hypothetical protein